MIFQQCFNVLSHHTFMLKINVYRGGIKLQNCPLNLILQVFRGTIDSIVLVSVLDESLFHSMRRLATCTYISHFLFSATSPKY